MLQCSHESASTDTSLRPQQPSTPCHKCHAGAYRPTDFFETSAMLITFILLGKYLEAAAKGRTSDAITKLMQLTPATAILLEASCMPLLTWNSAHAAEAGQPWHSPVDKLRAPKCLECKAIIEFIQHLTPDGASLLLAGTGCQCIGHDALPSCLSIWR